MFFFGGDYKAQSLLQNGRQESGEWTQLTLLNRGSNEPFEKFTSNACSAKLDHNRFLVFGGNYILEDGSESVLADIFEVDIFDRKVQKLGEMNHARTQHACAMISHKMMNEAGKMTSSQVILISGGVNQADVASTIVNVVELFLLNQRKSIDLTNEMLEPRFKHRMIQLGTDPLALGGETQDGTTKSIEKFNFDKDISIASLVSGNWTSYSKRLKSNSTNNLGVAALPKSAAECNKVPCECGKPRASRIVGGTAVRDFKK